jgi:sigma-E factor negative regulatory protein RseA
MLKGHRIKVFGMQKEKLSSFMDGELVKDEAFISSLSIDKELQSQWYRYHLAKDALNNRLNDQILSVNICEQVSQIIKSENIEPIYLEQELPSDKNGAKMGNLFWPKFKDAFSRVGQVGLAACVTLSIIAGVQFYNSQNDTDSEMFRLNTAPVGIKLSPVGGIDKANDVINNTTNDNKLSAEEYEKIHLLLQDYELQKRLNATH